MIFFLGLYREDHRGVDDLFASITGDFLVINDKERICTFDALAISIWYFPYTLAEASHFVGEGLVTNVCLFGVVTQLAIL